MFGFADSINDLINTMEEAERKKIKKVGKIKIIEVYENRGRLYPWPVLHRGANRKMVVYSYNGKRYEDENGYAYNLLKDKIGQYVDCVLYIYETGFPYISDVLD